MFLTNKFVTKEKVSLTNKIPSSPQLSPQWDLPWQCSPKLQLPTASLASFNFFPALLSPRHWSPSKTYIVCLFLYCPSSNTRIKTVQGQGYLLFPLLYLWYLEHCLLQSCCLKNLCWMNKITVLVLRNSFMYFSCGGNIQTSLWYLCR